MNALAAFERPALPVELRLQLATSFASGVKGTGGIGVQPRHGGGDQRPTITAWARVWISTSRATRRLGRQSRRRPHALFGNGNGIR